MTETYLLSMAPMVRRAMEAAALGAERESRSPGDVLEFKSENAHSEAV